MTVIDLTSTTPAGTSRGLWRRAVSRAWRGIVAGIAASVLLGAVARLLMRLATIATGGDPGFSWTGTLGICVGWAMFTLPGALVAALYLGRGRSVVLAVGALWLAYFATVVARADLGDLGQLSAGQQAGGLAAAAGVLLTALAIPWVTLRIMRALGVQPTRRSLRHDGSTKRSGTARFGG